MPSLNHQTVCEPPSVTSAAPVLANVDRARSGVSLSRARTRAKKIWIDLENSPHVPFFKPIIEELERRGHSTFVTARDCFQVCELADLFRVQYKRIGRHYGKHTLAKLAGLGVRVLQLTPSILAEKPDLAISHGSRSLFVLSSILRIPSITIFDYEFARWVGFMRHSWVMAPDVIPEEAVFESGIAKEHILRYPGIKEDVYAPTFQPDPSIRKHLGLNSNDLIVTIRPPATEAHYHNPESRSASESSLGVSRCPTQCHVSNPSADCETGIGAAGPVARSLRQAQDYRARACRRRNGPDLVL